MLVACYVRPGSRRSLELATAMAEGIRAAGDGAVLVRAPARAVEADVALAYGWREADSFELYRRAGRHFVALDLGFWQRKPAASAYAGYHKVAVDGRDPLRQLGRGRPADRLAALGVAPKPWRKSGRHIVLAGMSAKSAGTYGLAPEQWERAMARRLGQSTDRPIVYRPKPSWPASTRIAGTALANPELPLEALLEDAWMLVAHHSNAAVDALLAGVPVCVETGVAQALTLPALAAINGDWLPEGREAFLADLAYCQWSRAEMASGACWRHLKAEGLL